MKKNIQNSIDTNWKSYQAVAQANIHSLENLEIISYTRFKSSTRLYVGDDILVNNKLARIGTVFVDEVYGHRYSIAYPEMSLGHEEIIFAIEWVEDVSLLPGDNNLTGFRLEQVDANELVIDMQGEMTSLTVTPYKTLVTPTNSLDDIDNIFQSEFKGTDTIDVIGEGPSETITDIETISSGESTFTEYQLVGTNVDGLISVNGVEQVVESEVTEDTYKSGNISNPTHFDITNTQLRDIEINFTFNVSDIGTEKYLISASSSSNDNDHRYYLVIKPDRIFINFGSGTAGGGLNKTILNNTDYKVRFIVNDNICIVYLDDIKIIDVSNVDMPTIHDRGLTLAGGASVSMTDISIPTYTTETTTFTTQTVDTNSLEITTDGTFDSLDYSTTISTPTEIVTDITKTITQDAQQENWTKYQLEAKNLDGTITVNGVEQVVENTKLLPTIIDVPLTVNIHTGLTNVERINNYNYNFIGQFATVCYDIPDNIGVVTIRFSLSMTGVSGAYFGFGDSPTANIGNSHMSSGNSKLGGVGIHEYTVDCTNLTNKSFYFSDGTSYNTGSFEILSVTIPTKGGSITTFAEQLVDTNTLELAVSGTVERIDTKTYINEDIITTIQDTDSIIELEISDLPYTLTQEIDQTDFNNYLISGKGMTNQTVVTVNDLIQTVEFDIEGVSTLETTNDLLDIIRVFDYSVVADDNLYSDFTFNSASTFQTMEDIELGQQLILDNLNYATLDSKELLPILNESVTETISFLDTTTITNATENWLDYKVISTEVDGDLIINGLTQIVESTEEVEIINFDILFQNGFSINNCNIDYANDQIWGTRSESGTGCYSMNMQEVYDTGCRELDFTVTSGINGAIYIGGYIDSNLVERTAETQFYDLVNAHFVLNLETKVLTFSADSSDSRYDLIPDLTGFELSEIIIGGSDITSADGWQQWSVTPFTKTLTTFEKVEIDTNELIIEGACESLDYTTTTLNYLQPEYTVTHQNYSKTTIESGVSHNFTEATEPRYITKKPIKKIIISDITHYGSYIALGGVSFFNGETKFNIGATVSNTPTIFSTDKITATASSTYTEGSMYYAGYPLLHENADTNYQYWLPNPSNLSQTMTYIFTDTQYLDKMTMIPTPVDTNRGIVKATITSYDEFDNIIGTTIFNTPEVLANAKYLIDLEITSLVLPITMKSFEFPSLAVSYYDIDLETTIGPIDKQYDSINISEENITFDYNDETKANTNKISFEPENIKEIIIKSKKIQEDN